jgi:hypothetical protein
MTITTLKLELDLLKIDQSNYSLDGRLKYDAIILNKDKDIWGVFYMDEKGRPIDEKKFESEDDACEYIYEQFKRARDIRGTI